MEIMVTVKAKRPKGAQQGAPTNKGMYSITRAF